MKFLLAIAVGVQCLFGFATTVFAGPKPKICGFLASEKITIEYTSMSGKSGRTRTSEKYVIRNEDGIYVLLYAKYSVTIESKKDDLMTPGEYTALMNNAIDNESTVCVENFELQSHGHRYNNNVYLGVPPTEYTQEAARTHTPKDVILNASIVIYP
ncbi:MAG: hypothetical protein R3A45_01450 [Bdellovibrionota bacterium]